MKQLPSMTEIATGLRFPEGPVPMPDGSVVLVEIERKVISRIWRDGSKTIVARPGGGPNGLARAADGTFYLANNGGFAFAEDDKGLRVSGQAGPTIPAAASSVSIPVTARSPNSVALPIRALRCAAPTTSWSTAAAASGSPTSANGASATSTMAASTGCRPTTRPSARSSSRC